MSCCISRYHQKDKDKQANKGSQNVVHERLECRQGVAQPERHHQELIQAVVGAERRLVDVPRTHEHLMVLGAKVQLGEEACPVELVQQLVHHWDRERVLDSEGVQCAVVDAETLGPVGLHDEDDR